MSRFASIHTSTTAVRRCARRLLAALTSAALLGLATAQAGIIKVGTPVGPGQCSCDNLQCAFDFARYDGPHTVRITRSASYTGQNAVLTLDSNATVTIEGGYATCDQAEPDTTPTTISGLGGSDDSVLEFALGPSSAVYLRRVIVRDGDDGNGYGGGIQQIGGLLRIDDSTISDNVAEVGGGIYVQDGNLEIGSNVVIRRNSARDGGGVALRRADLFMNDAGSLILLNQAETGYGGGLWVGPGSHAEIGAPGLPGVGVIYANRAAHGGGVAAIADEDAGAFLDMISVDPGKPAGIVANLASVRGGGLYLRSACCIPYAGTQGTFALADLGAGAHISDNGAPDGAAAYLDPAPSEDIGPGLTIVDGAIERNFTRQLDNTPTNGAIFHVGDDPGMSGQGTRGLKLAHTHVQFNDGGHLVRSDGLVRIDNTLVADNVSRLSLFRGIGSDGGTQIVRTTIAGNSIGGSAVLDTSNDVVLRGSILHQPGKTSLLRSGGERTVKDVVASEIASLTPIPDGTIVQADPMFLDPEAGDYRLHAASIAVDAQASGSGVDLDGEPREVDLAEVGNRLGAVDLGAYERQSLDPLVRNGTFVDLRQWWYANQGTFVADSAQADGSGGVYVAALAPANGRALGPIQCVPLPTRGNYGLRGWAKEPSATMASADTPRLEWQLILGSTTCSGATSSSGGIALPGGNAWAPSASTFFSVPNDGSLRPQASVLISLVAVDGNVSAINTVDAYFDNIVLEYTGMGNLSPTVVASLPNRTNSENDSVSIESAPSFTDPDGDALSYSATNLPQGISIDPLTGTLFGTLGTISSGSYSVQVRATDPFGASVIAAFNWTVIDVPIVDDLFRDGFE